MLININNNFYIKHNNKEYNKMIKNNKRFIAVYKTGLNDYEVVNKSKSAEAAILQALADRADINLSMLSELKTAETTAIKLEAYKVAFADLAENLLIIEEYN